MDKIRIGILGASDIAYRRFLPALKKLDRFEFAGVAVTRAHERGEAYDEASYAPLLQEKIEKAQKYTDEFGGKVYVGYEDMLSSSEIDAVYIPLPPSLHFKWAKRAIMLGKHVLSEKPCTTNPSDTEALAALAEEKQVVLNENYAFCMHKQVEVIRNLIDSGVIGEVRLIRSAFGFPYRNASDFRYHAGLGGGALLDCGGYVLKVARLFMDENVRITTAVLHHTDKHDVDIYGSAVLADRNFAEAQLAFGMDNSYKCELEIWGSKAHISAPRIFTPPADFRAQIVVKGQTEEIITVEPDDQFMHAIEYFGACIDYPMKRKEALKDIVLQSQLTEEIRIKNAMLRKETI